MDYKKRSKEISDILDELIILLRYCNESEWADLLKYFRNDCEFVRNEQDVDLIRREILHIYGGMGSFNDLVAYREDEGIVGNEKFAVLRTKLFDTILNQL